MSTALLLDTQRVQVIVPSEYNRICTNMYTTIFTVTKLFVLMIFFNIYVYIYIHRYRKCPSLNILKLNIFHSFDREIL